MGAQAGASGRANQGVVLDPVGALRALLTKISLLVLADLGIVGGSVYDALIGQDAATHRRIRDRRAERTYCELDVSYRFVD